MAWDVSLLSWKKHTKDDMPNREDIIIFEKELRSALDCDVISDYTEYMYSSDLFYNSVLHMTNEARKKEPDNWQRI